MRPSNPANNNAVRWLLTSLIIGFCAAPAVAFDLDSDSPIAVSADNARLDDTKGVATYNGDVVVTQDNTRLTADKVVLYRDADGLNRIEAYGKPARYQQTAANGEDETDARALSITYSARESRLTFEREAVVEQAGNIFRGDQIDYNTAERIVTAKGSRDDSSDSQGRVEMVIQPRSGKAATRSTPEVPSDDGDLP
ncbi:lipopolysaccharide transport periplasmic protein LptA [Marinobacter caseinilyticus]|uniref:lipopolysaccharide transport periplasmic protein LptA n=1 Tax=Marinobacter caseinilyticus TaxID=2692195 RepID=UPI00140BD69A|nr:lipopolysaccharide transport periplasmic protein LptA [Marinobacter caseinilyticus]